MQLTGSQTTYKGASTRGHAGQQIAGNVNAAMKNKQIHGVPKFAVRGRVHLAEELVHTFIDMAAVPANPFQEWLHDTADGQYLQKDDFAQVPDQLHAGEDVNLKAMSTRTRRCSY